MNKKERLYNFIGDNDLFLTKKSNVEIIEKEFFNHKKCFKKLNQQGLVNISGGVSAKQLIIKGSLLSLILLGGVAVNNSIDVYADDTPQSSISQTMSNAKPSKQTGKTVPQPQTKTFKIIKPSFKNTARGKLHLQRQRQEDAKRLALRREHQREYQRQWSANLSEDKKQERNERQRGYDRQRYANRTEEQKQNYRERHREGQRQRYANRTEEQKQRIREYQRQRYANLSAEKKQHIREYQRQRYANLSAEQKQRHRERSREYQRRLRAARRQAANAADHASDESSLEISLANPPSTYEPTESTNSFEEAD